MQYGQALDRLLRDIVYADPDIGYVYLLKANVSDGFYCIGLRSEDTTKLSLILPSGEDKEPMVATPLMLSMGWKNLPPYYVLPRKQQRISSTIPFLPISTAERNRAEAIVPPPAPPLAEEHAKLTHNPQQLRPKATLLAYMDVFVDDLLGLAQGPWHRCRHVRRRLYHALDKVFRLLDRQDTKQRKEFLSMKKLEAGDYSWSTCQTMIRWIVDSVNMIINLHLYHVARLKGIVYSIPCTQHRVGF